MSEQISDYVPITHRAYYYRAHAALKVSGRAIMCEGCDCERTSNLQVHHVDGDITNNTPDNLKYLCISCHSLVHPDRAEFMLSKEI